MKRRQTLSLNLEAFARVGEYANDPQHLQSEYRIHFHLSNPTDRVVRFDTLETSISPAFGTPLKVKLFAKPEREGPEILELGPGEDWTGEMSTNGYTRLLLSDARGTALRIAVTLKRGAIRVDGPFHGFLPDLSELPVDESGPFSFGVESSQPGRRILLGAEGAN